MRKEIITAIDRDGIEVRIHSLVFNIYKEKINLIDTIKDAVASYINSGYGFREFLNLKIKRKEIKKILTYQ